MFKIRLHLYSFLVIALMYFFSMASHAQAYLDPGTGSYLFQMLIAGFLGSTFFAKTFWHKIKNKFRNRSENKENTPNA